jgi:hypothetical protein
MILGGDIYQMHTKKRDPYLKKEDIGMVPGGSDLSQGQRHVSEHVFFSVTSD